MRFFQLLSVFLGFIYSDCYSQKTYKIPSKFSDEIAGMYSRELNIKPNTDQMKSMVNYSALSPIFMTSDTIDEYALPKGVYLLSPPMDPKIEFICLVSDSIIALNTKTLKTDFFTISDFLKKHRFTDSDEEWVVFFERLSNAYRERNPGKRKYLPN